VVKSRLNTTDIIKN